MEIGSQNGGSEGSEGSEDIIRTLPEGEVKNSSKIYRLGDSDIWACHGCKIKDDIHFMKQHRCQGKNR